MGDIIIRLNSPGGSVLNGCTSINYLNNPKKINVETRTTWVLLAIRLCCWLKITRLLRLLNNSIIARVYTNGELSKELRFEIK